MMLMMLKTSPVAAMFDGPAAYPTFYTAFTGCMEALGLANSFGISVNTRQKSGGWHRV